MQAYAGVAPVKMKAMLLAAGRGKRLGPLTDSTPKPLLKIGRETLIERHIRRLKQAGFKEIVINVSYLRAKIIHRLGDGSRYGVRIYWSDEGEHRLETGGGIRKALPLLGDSPWLVMNSDIYTDWVPKPVTLAEPCLAHLILVANMPHCQGDFYLDNGTVRRHHAKAERLTFSGIGYYDAALFESPEQQAFKLTEVLNPAIADNRVSGEKYTGKWADLGTPESLQRLIKTGISNVAVSAP